MEEATDSTSASAPASAPSSSVHVFSTAETRAFVEHINACCGHALHPAPLNADASDLFERVRSGTVFCLLLNSVAPGALPMNKVHIDTNLEDRRWRFYAIENHNLALNAARRLGCAFVNVSAEDLMDGALKVIKLSMLYKVNLRHHPELYHLREETESVMDLLKIPADVLLMRWVNYHLRAVGVSDMMTNFSTDVQDSVKYIHLFNHLFPSSCNLDPLQENDLITRASQMLEQCETVHCKKFVDAADIAMGNPHLNLMFVAHAFHASTGLSPLTESQATEVREAVRLIAGSTADMLGANDDGEICDFSESSSESISDSLSVQIAESSDGIVEDNKLSPSVAISNGTENSLAISDMKSEDVDASSSYPIEAKAIDESSASSAVSAIIDDDLNSSNVESSTVNVLEKRSSQEKEGKEDDEARTNGMHTASEDQVVKEAIHKCNCCNHAEEIEELRNRIAALEAENDFVRSELECERQSREQEIMQHSQAQETWKTTTEEMQHQFETVDAERDVQAQLNETLRARIVVLESNIAKQREDWQNEIDVVRLTMLREQDARVASLTLQLKKCEDQLNYEKMARDASEQFGEDVSLELRESLSRAEKTTYLLEHLKQEKARSLQRIERLRILYNTFKTTEALCAAIYSDLSLANIMTGSSRSGFLTKKARNGNNWRRRFFVLKDSFLLYYKSDDVRTTEGPQGAVRVDDAVMRFADNPTKKSLGEDQAAILCIEILDHNTGLKNLHFYVSGTQEELDSWLGDIQNAANWWTGKKIQTSVSQLPILSRPASEMMISSPTSSSAEATVASVSSSRNSSTVTSPTLGNAFSRFRPKSLFGA